MADLGSIMWSTDSRRTRSARSAEPAERLRNESEKLAPNRLRALQWQSILSTATGDAMQCVGCLWVCWKWSNMSDFEVLKRTFVEKKKVPLLHSKFHFHRSQLAERGILTPNSRILGQSLVWLTPWAQTLVPRGHDRATTPSRCRAVHKNATPFCADLDQLR